MEVNAFSILIGFWMVHIKIGYKLNLEILNTSSEFRHEQKRQKEQHEANRVVNDKISSLKVKHLNAFRALFSSSRLC